MTRIILDELLTFSLPTVDADGIPTAADDVTLTVFDLGHPDGSPPIFSNGTTDGWGVFYGGLSTGHQYVYVDALECNDFRPGAEYLIEANIELGANTGFKGWRFKVESNARFAKRSLLRTFAHAPDGGGDTSFDIDVLKPGSSPRLMTCLFVSGGSGAGVLSGADGTDVLAADAFPRFRFQYEAGVTTIGNFKTALAAAMPGSTVTSVEADGTLLDGTLVSNNDEITWENYLMLRAVEYGTEWNDVSVFWDDDVTGGDEYLSLDNDGWHIHYEDGVTEWDDVIHMLRETDVFRLQSPTPPPAGGNTLVTTNPISDIITNGEEWVLGGGRGYEAEVVIPSVIDANVVQVSGDSTAADNLEAQFDGTGLSGATFPARQDAAEVRRNTATAGAAGTITLDGSASAVNDFYNLMAVTIVSGTGAGQTRLIYDYDGGTKVASVTPNWTTSPAAASVFVIHPWASVNVEAWKTDNAIDVPSGGRITGDVRSWNSQDVLDLTGGRMLPSAEIINNGTAAAGAATTITLGATGYGIAATSSVDDFYNGARILIVFGVGVGQERIITDYVGATKVATVDTAWVTNPNATSQYIILAGGRTDKSGLATSAEIAALPTAAEIDTELTASHGAGTWGGDDAATIVAALMAHDHDTGVTVLGLLKRLEALVSGKATGLNGALARFYLRDGTTIAIEAVQDVDAGTRATADVSGSE